MCQESYSICRSWKNRDRGDNAMTSRSATLVEKAVYVLANYHSQPTVLKTERPCRLVERIQDLEF